MSPENENIMGYTPFSKIEDRFTTPLYFNKELSKKTQESVPFSLSQFGIKHNATDSPVSIVYHEIGHVLHKESEKDPEKAMNIWKEMANDGYDIDLAKEVGYYALTGDKYGMGHEFVAEVFAGAMEGKHYSKRVMDIYNALGGPKIL